MPVHASCTRRVLNYIVTWPIARITYMCDCVLICTFHLQTGILRSMYTIVVLSDLCIVEECIPVCKNPSVAPSSLHQGIIVWNYCWLACVSCVCTVVWQIPDRKPGLAAGTAGWSGRWLHSLRLARWGLGKSFIAASKKTLWFWPIGSIFFGSNGISFVKTGVWFSCWLLSGCALTGNYGQYFTYF